MVIAVELRHQRLMECSASAPPSDRLHIVSPIFAVPAAWALVAIAFSLQGYALALYRGVPQPWWPSLGYALAIFSIWAILTPVIVVGVEKVRRLSPVRRLLALAFGLPVVAALHVALFAFAFWPIYNGDGKIPTRRAMAERMALRNLDTNALFYLLVVGGALWRQARGERIPAPSRPEPPAPAPTALHIRSRGRLRVVNPEDIDWVAAAGDYVELHGGGQTHLIETSLVSFERSLPPGEFARIHRGSLVRVDRVAEMRGLGRGDALVLLVDGTKLRLSRRYRANLAALLRPVHVDGPARRLDRSRLPNGPGETA